MLSLLADTGLGSCLLIAAVLVGVPLVWRADAKKKPGAGTPGQNI